MDIAIQDARVAEIGHGYRVMFGYLTAGYVTYTGHGENSWSVLDRRHKLVAKAETFAAGILLALKHAGAVTINDRLQQLLVY
jgi:hypothetical protein